MEERTLLLFRKELEKTLTLCETDIWYCTNNMWMSCWRVSLLTRIVVPRNDADNAKTHLGNGLWLTNLRTKRRT